MFKWRWFSRTPENPARSANTVTIRYMFSTALGGGILALSLLASLSSSTDSSVVLKSSSQIVEIGDIYSLEVSVDAKVPINAVEFDVVYPEEYVSVFGVDRGQSVLTIWTEDPEIEEDRVTFSGGTFRRGFLGKHQIAVINFRAESVGQYSLQVENVRLIAGDGVGTEVLLANTRGQTVFNFDENTSEEEIQVAVKTAINTDLNNDGQVTLQDISAFMGAWSNRSETHDFNGDGMMTFRDFSIILADFFFR